MTDVRMTKGFDFSAEGMILSSQSSRSVSACCCRHSRKMFLILGLHFTSFPAWATWGLTELDPTSGGKRELLAYGCENTPRKPAGTPSRVAPSESVNLRCPRLKAKVVLFFFRHQAYMTRRVSPARTVGSECTGEEPTCLMGRDCLQGWLSVTTVDQVGALAGLWLARQRRRLMMMDVCPLVTGYGETCRRVFVGQGAAQKLYTFWMVHRLASTNRHPAR